MKNMLKSSLIIKFLCIFASVFFLSSCMIVHKMDIEQGNILCPEQLAKLHRGMTIGQAKSIMGTPLLINPFNDNRVDYVYSYKPGHGATCVKSVILIFSHGILKEIVRNT